MLVAPWAVPADMEFTACSAADPDAVLGPLAVASDILYELTGRRWPGVGVDTIRPCTPLRSGTGGWCGCDGPNVCGCLTPGLVELPGVPAVAVEEVVVDGQILDASEYRLIGQMLLRMDDQLGWPCCQDLRAAGNEAGGWQVQYTWGAEPPEAARTAAAVLACELHRSACGDSACRLPKRVTTVSRQGVSFAMLDPLTLFSDGLTGISEVDLWLASLRIGDRSRRGTVMIPGARQRNLREQPTTP